MYMIDPVHTKYSELVEPFKLEKEVCVDFWQDNYPEFALYGHTMMSKPGKATKQPGGFVSKH